MLLCLVWRLIAVANTRSDFDSFELLLQRKQSYFLKVDTVLAVIYFLWLLIRSLVLLKQGLQGSLLNDFCRALSRLNGHRKSCKWPGWLNRFYRSGLLRFLFGLGRVGLYGFESCLTLGLPCSFL
jgi:hypothetical protein